MVDMGDEKTHICCVEDGISNPNTRYFHKRKTVVLYIDTSHRITLHYGGSDITRLFYWMIRKACIVDYYCLF